MDLLPVALDKSLGDPDHGPQERSGQAFILEGGDSGGLEEAEGRGGTDGVKPRCSQPPSVEL